MSSDGPTLNDDSYEAATRVGVTAIPTATATRTATATPAARPTRTR